MSRCFFHKIIIVERENIGMKTIGKLMLKSEQQQLMTVEM